MEIFAYKSHLTLIQLFIIIKFIAYILILVFLSPFAKLSLSLIIAISVMIFIGLIYKINNKRIKLSNVILYISELI